jgi:AcrR family transcriptional regulator
MSPVRVPQQSRSRALVARVLQSAGELFAAEGYEQTTTNGIAAAAGVSVGSVYQFFIDKHAILDALQADWAERLGRELDASLRIEDLRPIPDIVDEVLEVHARLDREQPGLLAVLLTTRGSRQVTSTRDAIQQRLEQIIARREPEMLELQRRMAAAMLIHLSLGLYTLPRSIDPDRRLSRAEVRRALISYLDALHGGQSS